MHIHINIFWIPSRITRVSIFEKIWSKCEYKIVCFFYCRVVWSVYKMWSQMSMIILVTHLTRRLLCFLTRTPAPVCFLTLSYCLNVCHCRPAAADCVVSCPTVLQDTHANQIIHTRHLTQSLHWVFLMQIEKFTFHLHFTHFDLDV